MRRRNNRPLQGNGLRGRSNHKEGKGASKRERDVSAKKRLYTGSDDKPAVDLGPLSLRWRKFFCLRLAEIAELQKAALNHCI